MKRDLVVIIHDVRSCHNVGAIIRTAEGLGVKHIYMTGYTPYPQMKKDNRLPHIARKINSQICKTSLGAELSIKWSTGNIGLVLSSLKDDEYQLMALEQTTTSKPLYEIVCGQKVAVIVGNEISGLDSAVLDISDTFADIPMLGAKESFNVSAAAAMAIYSLRFY